MNSILKSRANLGSTARNAARRVYRNAESTVRFHRGNFFGAPALFKARPRAARGLGGSAKASIADTAKIAERDKCAL
jgi:hypothetical protein